MSDPTLVNPVAYQPSFEQPEEGEDATVADMQETFVSMASTMADHTGHAMRAVHAKGHCLLQGSLQVMGDLPPQLAQGIFELPRTYQVLVRMSSPPAEQLPDNISTPRGFALKVLDVPGVRLPGSEADTSQDFLMVNGPVFGTPGPKGFLKTVKLLASTTDKAPRSKEVLAAVLRGTEKLIEAVGGESKLLKGLGGHPETHPLGETFFTQVPCLYGPYMAKFSLVPVSPALLALKDQPLDMENKTDAMRDALNAFFATAGEGAAEWELRVQLCSDLDKMPIEDASVAWPEDLSPFIAVARLRIAAQTAWDDSVSPAQEDALSFNPWHAVAAHRPIGSIMRARKLVYASSVGFRAGRNGCPVRDHLLV